MPAVTLFSGPRHIIEWIDDEAQRRSGHTDSILGLPYREAFPHPLFRPSECLLDQVFSTGEAIERPDWHSGWLVLTPRVEDGLIVGVAGCWWPADLEVAAPAPPLRRPLLPSDWSTLPPRPALA